MILNKIIFEFDAQGSNKQDLWVTNTGAENIYVDISVDEILNPGSYPMQRRTLNDPLNASLLVTPNKLIVGPNNDKKLVRFLVVNQLADKERVYRVKVIPKVGKVSLTKGDSSQKQAGIKILVGYETIVLVAPKNPKPQVSFARNKKKLTISNKGNVNVFINYVEQCTKDGKCDRANGPRVYANTSVTIDIPLDTVAKVYQKIGNDYNVIMVP